MRKLRNRILTFVLFFASALSILAQDVVEVQTFTFEDITKRRGIFTFPDNDDTYRKILLFYTLKCDPRTTRDQFNCGEWDYLTYSIVHQHTGVMDSNETTHPLYMVGKISPDTIKYSEEPIYSNYQSEHKLISIDNVISEEEFTIGNPDSDLNILLNEGPTKFQFFLPKSILKDADKNNFGIRRIKFFVDEVGGELKNFTVKVKKYGGNVNDSEFESGSFTTLYRYNTQLVEGWNYINLESEYKWSSLFNVCIEFSYETEEGYTPNEIRTDANFSTLSANTDKNYLLFDGERDVVECTNIQELNSAATFTWEANVRIDKWQAWKSIFGKAGRTLLQTGNNEGQLYCIVRNPDNTHGNAKNVIRLGEWNHVAMVYDGNEEDNQDKLKLYINGKKEAMSFTGTIPDMTEDTKQPLVLGDGINGAITNARIWSSALSEGTLADWQSKQIDNTHPDFDNLVLSYDMNESSGFYLIDGSGNGYNGTLLGAPAWRKMSGEELTEATDQSQTLPVFTFCEGEYNISSETVVIDNLIAHSPISIQTYEIIDKFPTITNVEYKYEGDIQTYNYAPDGTQTDRDFIEATGEIINEELNYFGEPFEIIDPVEIGRFITPYGIGLDLGPEGFTWVYDVTDYAHLLKGEVDLSSGNQQELIDMRFEFYKGTPPRNVININRIWGPMRSYSYKSFSDDTQLSEVDVTLHPDAKQFKMKTRLTGHGHNSNDGSYPHCCEWKNNTHSLSVNGNKAAEWHIWQYFECSANPVYPQGGTWPQAREGWCPGDIVKDFEFEITDFVSGPTVKIDYDITKVPDNNQGMGNGNYVTAMHLVEYGDNNFELDAEIVDVIAPNDFDLYSRTNPSCSAPLVIVRNNGIDPLTKLTFEYGVSGGEIETFYWSGNIAPHMKQTIGLPIFGTDFWLGDEDNKFNVTISAPNDGIDEYSENDVFETQFTMPEVHTDDIQLWIQSSDRQYDYELVITDAAGNEVFTKSTFDKTEVFKLPLDFEDGCYTISFKDVRNQIGLSYWVYRNYFNNGQYPDYIPGWFRIVDADGKPVKTFESEFGTEIKYSFAIGGFNHVEDANDDYLVNVYPNPVEDKINLRFDYEIGKAELTIFDLKGNIILSKQLMITQGLEETINTLGLAAGFYGISIVNDKFDIKKNFLVK